MAISTLPPAPARTDAPSVFVPKADAFLGALQTFGTEANALAEDVNSKQVITANNAISASNSAASALASKNSAADSAASAILAPGSNGTSTTSLSVASGNISLTTQTGKAFVVGSWVNITRTSDVSKSMLGQISSYNSGTGAMVVSVAAANIQGVGSGPYTDWSISQSSMPGNVITAVELSNVGPSIKPSLLCDFANSKRLDPRFTYTMASPLSYFDAAGILRYAAPGVPAFDHDPATLVCRGWSAWEARTNLALYSEQFDNAAHAKTRATITTNAAVAPDGNTTAEKLVEDSTASSNHYTQQNFAGLTAGAHTASVFAKKAERTRIQIASWDGVSGLTAVFNLATGVVDVASAGVTAKMEALPNGWYRCIATRTIAGTTLQNIIYLDGAASGGDTSIYSGNGASGAYIWGLDVEPGAFATPYTPTTSAAVTRSAPTLTMATSAFDFNPLEGTLYGESQQAAAGGVPLAVIRGPSSGDRLQFDAGHAGVVVAGSTVADLFTVTPIAGEVVKTAFAYRANDFAISKSGASVQTDVSGAVPSVTYMTLGYYDFGGANVLNGWLSKFAYYPRRLANSEQVALSTL